jgi:hypothetical protein
MVVKWSLLNLLHIIIIKQVLLVQVLTTQTSLVQQLRLQSFTSLNSIRIQSRIIKILIVLKFYKLIVKNKMESTVFQQLMINKGKEIKSY